MRQRFFKYYTVILGICCSMLTACVEEITLPIGSGSRMLQVEGEITTDTMAHQIKLHFTNDLYSTDPFMPVTGALVTITQADSVHVLTEKEPGIYETSPDYYAMPDKTYRLDITGVDIDGEAESYWAESSIYYLEQPDSISIKKYAHKEGYLEIHIHMTDDRNIENYYLGKLSVNDIGVTDTLNDWFLIDDELFNGNRISGNFPIFVVAQKGYESDDEYEVTLKDGDKVTLHVYGIPKNYYEFVNALFSSGAGSNPMMGSPASPPTNIYPKGKACGFFSIQYARQNSMIYHEDRYR